MFLKGTNAVAVESTVIIENQDDFAMAFLDYLAITAILSTLGMFLTGISICQTIKRKGTSEGISAAPLILCCVSCFFWLRYGLLKSDQTVIFINVAGLVLELAYTYYYYIYTPRKGFLNRLLLISVATCVGMMAYIDVVSPPHDTAVNHLGMMCLILNILNFGAPLAGMKEVIRTKSAESLPGLLILANLIVAFQWFLYGYLVNDIYMKVPNAIGMLLSGVQLALFAIYPPRKQAR